MDAERDWPGAESNRLYCHAGSPTSKNIFLHFIYVQWPNREAKYGNAPVNHTIIGFNKYFCRAFITEFGIELCKIMELTEFYTISNHTI